MEKKRKLSPSYGDGEEDNDREEEDVEEDGEQPGPSTIQEHLALKDSKLGLHICCAVPQMLQQHNLCRLLCCVSGIKVTCGRKSGVLYAKKLKKCE